MVQDTYRPKFVVFLAGNSIFRKEYFLRINSIIRVPDVSLSRQIWTGNMRFMNGMIFNTISILNKTIDQIVVNSVCRNSTKDF